MLSNIDHLVQVYSVAEAEGGAADQAEDPALSQPVLFRA
jgi:hypothetical protein